jgi:hypothetical protein
LDVGRLGTRGLDAFDELPELGEPRERILDTVVDLQKRDERLPVGQQGRRIADPSGCAASMAANILRVAAWTSSTLSRLILACTICTLMS